MPVYIVTARWIETFEMAVNADNPQEAEDYVNMLACDGGLQESSAQRYDAEWSLHTPYVATEDIDPRKLIDVTDG